MFDPSRFPQPALLRRVLILSFCILSFGMTARAADPPKQTYPSAQPAAKLPRVAVGTAVAERLGAVFIDGAGPFVADRAGDWRLSNEFVSLTFASVNDDYSSVSQPVSGFFETVRAEDRGPGVLIDVQADGQIIDTFVSFTQGIGLDAKGITIPYDTVEAVREDKEVGLRLEGSPFENAPIRMATTYWLGPAGHSVRIETTMSGLPENEPMPEVVDIGQWGPGSIFVPRHGNLDSRDALTLTAPFYGIRNQIISMVIAPAENHLHGIFIPSLQSSRVSALPRLPDNGTTATTSTLSASPPTPAGARLVRYLWLAGGELAVPLGHMFEDRKEPMGEITGEVRTKETNEPVANATIRILRGVEPKHGLTSEEMTPREFSYARSDEKGHYSARVPAGYYFIDSRFETHNQRRFSLSLEVVAGQTAKQDMKVSPRTGVRVKVVDADTSEPLVARLALEAINPRRYSPNLGPPITARHYLNYAYIPAEGDVLYLPAGDWAIKAGHGLNYEAVEISTTIENGKLGELTIPLKMNHPIPGWQGLEIGARTSATPGVTVSPEDLVLMAVAEGLDWLISGDLETLTDFAPVIEKMGLGGKLRSSRGFRTWLPAHPEWGQFLLYPIAKDDPDPKEARKKWASLKTSKEFIAALRKLYPDAIIQVELPYTREGLGYFGTYGHSPYEFTWEIDPKLEKGIDAVNIIPARGRWQHGEANSLFNNFLTKGNFYIPSTGSTGRCVYGAEPGYPRLLVGTQKTELSEITENDLFDAMRRRHVQLTTGPFVDVSIDRKLPGELIPYDAEKKVRMRVTAPTWMTVNRISYDKEAAEWGMNQFSQDARNVQRYPLDIEAKYEDRAIKDLGFNFADFKDTLFAVSVQAMTPIDMLIPRYPERPIIPFALVSPFIIDRNGNGTYDPLTSYAEKGQ